jgi:hypothetical protein
MQARLESTRVKPPYKTPLLDSYPYLKVNDSAKHSSLLHYQINYSHKNVLYYTPTELLTMLNNKTVFIAFSLNAGSKVVSIFLFVNYAEIAVNYNQSDLLHKL